MIDYIATHTPEPWVAVPVAAGSPEWGVLRQGEKAFVLIGAEKADAIRTAACVNACKGWPTEALEAFAADPAHPASLPAVLTGETRRAIAAIAERDAAVADAREMWAALQPLSLLHGLREARLIVERLAAKYGDTQ